MFAFSSSPIDGAALRASMADEGAGGFVAFEGWVRNSNEGHAVSSLEYEAFEELGRIEGDRILAEAVRRFGVMEARAAHRVGHLALGEIAVWIGVGSTHRDEAYRASRYIIDEIKSRLPIWKKEHYLDGRAEWVNCQECYRHAHPDSDFREESRFNSRQATLAMVGVEGQARLKRSSVLIVGAGGLGSPVLQGLAGAGVGRLTVVDFDQIDVSNLHRQPIYRFGDRGRDKASTAADWVRAYNPFVKVTALRERVDYANVNRLIAGHDLVVECSDSLETKFLVHDSCRLARIPMITGAVYQLEGEIQAFLPGQEGGCLRCLWPMMPATDCVGTCAQAGVLGATPAAIGALQGKLALDLLLGRSVAEEKILIDLETMEIRRMRIARRAGCELCVREKRPGEWTYRGVEEVPAATLAELASRFEMIDLREPEERSVETSVNRELRRFVRYDASSDLNSLPMDREYLLICQRGRRSLRAAKDMRSRSLGNFYSLAGGVESLGEIVG